MNELRLQKTYKIYVIKELLFNQEGGIKIALGDARCWRL